MLWCTETVLLDIRNQIPDLVSEERCHSKNAANADRQECQPSFAEIEVVDRRVDEREDFK